ncbi:MAG TPA: hypothetical protein VH913_26615 [Hyphomicrobiaceae bacterium]|jgi:hypothetical protein
MQVPAEAKLYAAGLGLMLFSPSALTDIPEGADFMSDLGSEPRGRLYDTLVATHRVVLLGTGSPQIYYSIRVVTAPAAPAGRVLRATEFGLGIEGGILAIRDGYAPMEWSIRDPYEIRFAVADGYHRVRALWMPRPDDSDADMHVCLAMEPTSRPVPGDGWPTLMYSVRLAGA